MVITFNRLNLTKQTFSSLLETTTTPFNLIVVDNGSEDGTPEYLDQFCQENVNKNCFKNFKIIKNTKNLGIAIGRNQALEKSTQEWLATIDNDVLLPAGWSEQCVKILQANPKYAAIGVNFEDATFPLIKDSNDNEFQHKDKGNLGTACMLFNRKIHKLLGYFNTEYGCYGEEDADLGARIRVLGLQLGYLKDNGQHLGSGENDQGPYREFKTLSHKKNLGVFNRNCAAYFQGKKSIYLPFKL